MAATIGTVEVEAEVEVKLTGAAARLRALELAAQVMTNPTMRASDATSATVNMAKEFEQYLTGETPAT